MSNGQTCTHCGARVVERWILGTRDKVTLDGRVFDSLPFRELKRAQGRRQTIRVYREHSHQIVEPVIVDRQPGYRFRRPHTDVCVTRRAA